MGQIPWKSNVSPTIIDSQYNSVQQQVQISKSMTPGDLKSKVLMSKKMIGYMYCPKVSNIRVGEAQA